MDEEPQSTDHSTDQSTDRKEGRREGGRIMRTGKEGRKRREQGEGECSGDTDQDLEAVLLCPVIDERRGDKKKKDRRQREEGMKMVG